MTTAPAFTIPKLAGKQASVFHHADARTNLLTGSVRSGKTVASSLTWVKYVTNEAPPGDLLMVGKTLGALNRNVINPLIDTFGSSVVYKKTAEDGTHEAYIGGRRLYLVGANDERSESKIRGMTIAGWYGDEITLWPESFFTMMLSRLSVENGRGFGTTNPDNPAHWLKAKYLDRRGELDLKVFEFTLDDNPHLPPAYVDALKREYVGLWYRRYILGQWVAAEGAIFDMLDPSRHMVDVLPVLTRHWLAIDYGTTNPTVWAYLSLGVDGRLYLHDSYRHDSLKAHRQKTDPEYSRDLQAHLLARDYKPETVWYDPSAASFGLQIWRDFRDLPALANVRPTPADNAVIDGIRDVASLFAADLLKIHRPSIASADWDELVGYAWDIKAAERGEDKPVKHADHFPDMVRYAVRGSRRHWRGLLTPTR